MSETPWVVAIDEKITNLSTLDFFGRQSQLRRIPPFIRGMTPHLYDSQVVALGLYNRDFVELGVIDQLKLHYVQEFLRYLNLRGKEGWSQFCDRVTASAPSVSDDRDISSGPINFYHEPPRESFLSEEAIVSVLTIDAVFVCALNLIPYVSRLRPSLNDEEMDLYAKVTHITCSTIVQSNKIALVTDLILFENQIPLFLLRNVLDLMFKQSSASRLDEFLKGWMDSVRMLGLPWPEDGWESVQFEDCNHLLQCLHKVACTKSSNRKLRSSRSTGCLWKFVSLLLYLLWCPLIWFQKLLGQSDESTMGDSNHWKTLPSATQLQEVGISCKGIQSGATDVKFVRSWLGLNATLHVPSIIFMDTSERVIRNLIAYELLTLQESRVFLAYMRFLDELVSTEEDVRLLRMVDDPVIRNNLLGSDQMLADLINRTMDNIRIEETDYVHLRTVMNEVHAWYKTRWRRQLTNFVSRFVRAPWITVTLAVATLLLIATILQTVYGTIEFYKPTS